MKRQLFYLSLSLLAVMFAACSSDTDGDGTGRAMYEYTPEQIQQIKNLQEEYGVTFNFPVNSSKGLPPVSDFEDLCKTFAYLNSAKEEVTRSGNTIKCRTVQRTRTRAFSRGVEETYYSGSEIGYGDLNGNNESYGSFSYLVSWEGVNSGHSKNVSYQIYSLQSYGVWELDLVKFSYNVGGTSLYYTFEFEAYNSKYLYSVRGLEYSSSATLTGQSVTQK